MKIHELKTWPAYFTQVWDGIKHFELRRDDREFCVGDVLHLVECDESEGYLGRIVIAEVTCILRDAPDLGLQPGFCILGIAVWRKGTL